MFVIELSKLINRNLIQFFDQSRVKYMIFVFPAYQFLAFISIAAVIFSLKAASTSFYFVPLGVILSVFIGVPIFASWHLSCLLFSIGYFGFLAWLGMPFMPWLTRKLEEAVNWFRLVQ